VLHWCLPPPTPGDATPSKYRVIVGVNVHRDASLQQHTSIEQIMRLTGLPLNLFHIITLMLATHP
jgi:hypothetical protein